MKKPKLPPPLPLAPPPQPQPLLAAEELVQAGEEEDLTANALVVWKKKGR